MIEEDIDIDERLTPEENLLVAIFIMALKDNLSDIKIKQEHKRTAMYYFDDLESSEYGSFGYFCEHFKLDPREARKKALSSGSLQILIEVGKVGK
jgi:hypothetical protein